MNKKKIMRERERERDHPFVQRFNLSDPTYEDLKALNPQSIMKKAIPSVAPLASKFPNIVNEYDLNSIDRE